ncbi:MAG: DMT family transporter [Desulfovibrio sp.]
MTKSWLLFVTFLAGACIPIQAGVNARLRASLGDAASASLVSFFVGTCVLCAWVALLKLPVPTMATFKTGPWWMWCGGIIGAFFVALSVFVAAKLGATSMIAWLVAGQLIASLILDHYGVLGFSVREITTPRMIGAILLIIGAFLTQK